MYTPGQFPPFQSPIIHTLSATALGPHIANLAPSTPASAAWPTGNKAIYIPFFTDRTVTIYQVGWYNGATPSGTREVGVYEQDGTKLVSGAATGTGANILQMVNITDYVLEPGCYYLAATDSGTGTWFASVPTAPQLAAIGVLSQVTANPLPGTATFALDQTLAFLPWAFLQTRVTL